MRAGIQYVQPVAVVPVGQPVPAVQAGDHQYTVPLTAATPDQITDRDITVGSYGAPMKNTTSEPNIYRRFFLHGHLVK